MFRQIFRLEAPAESLRSGPDRGAGQLSASAEHAVIRPHGPAAAFAGTQRVGVEHHDIPGPGIIRQFRFQVRQREGRVIRIFPVEDPAHFDRQGQLFGRKFIGQIPAQQSRMVLDRFHQFAGHALRGGFARPAPFDIIGMSPVERVQIHDDFQLVMSDPVQALPQRRDLFLVGRRGNAQCGIIHDVIVGGGG